MSEYINDGNRITFLGNIDYRNKEVKFGIKAKDRTRHMYVIGKSGMGKSTLLENMAIQDIQNGEGIAVIDPHGGMAEKLLNFIPEWRKDDVVYFNPADTEFPIALNVLEQVDPNKRHLVADGLMAAFKKAFGEDRFSDRIQYILNNILLTLLENKDETLMGINRILNDKVYRKRMVANVKDPSVKSFWEEEYASAGSKYQQEAAPGIQNKIGQFTSNPLIRNIIGQRKTSFDIREIMDNRKILIMNLSKGNLGVGNANLIGSLLITKIYLAAMGRADMSAYDLDRLANLYFYVDEFQNFANDSFADILSEARKYRLALTVAHQYIDQLTDEIKSAILGNVGTMITFRVGATDAEVFEKEFAPVFTADDIVNLGAYQMYLRLMIDNVSSKPFSANGLAPTLKPEISYAREIINLSREKYGKKKELVEEEIKEWFKVEDLERREPNTIYATTNPNQDKPKTYNNFEKNLKVDNKVQNNHSYTTNTFVVNNPEQKENKSHVRSKREDFKKRRDIHEVDMSQVRVSHEQAKIKKEENNTSLKDAIEQALKHNQKVEAKEEVVKEKDDAESRNNYNQAESQRSVKDKDAKQNNAHFEERGHGDKLNEVPEKILRSVVED